MAKKKNATPVDPAAVEEAKKLIISERDRVIDACSKEINEVLKKHNCSLDITKPQLYITPKG